MSQVEDTLRIQRETWREISPRVSQSTSRDLPSEHPRRIFFFGEGSSFFAAKLTAFALIRDRSRERIPVQAIASTSVGVEVTPTKGDWAFGFSHRGKTATTLLALEKFQQAGAFTVLVGGQEVEENLNAQFILKTSPMEKTEAHTVSVSSAICAVTSLLLGPKVLEEWNALAGIPEPSLDVLRERLGNGPDVTLGEWEGEWLAREAALKLMEMARVPARAFGTEEFFHGPLKSTKKTPKIWHFSMAKDLHNDDLKKEHSILVSSASPLSFIPALVELQWSALAVALNRKEDPDQK